MLKYVTDTHHEDPLLQASIDATLISVIRKDSPSRDLGSDQVDRSVDRGVCRVIFGGAYAGSEVGKNQLVDIKFEAKQ